MGLEICHCIHLSVSSIPLHFVFELIVAEILYCVYTQ